MVVSSPEEMKGVAEMLLARIGAEPTLHVVGLSGDLGAGKTTFVRELLAMIGVSDRATSPTFVVRKAYPVPADSPLAPRFSLVSHVDAYRLNQPEDMGATGIASDAERTDVLLLVEWPERLAGALERMPGYLGTMQFEHVDEETRRVTLL